MIHKKLQEKYPQIYEELEYKDITYQRYIHQNNMPYILSWLNEGRQAYRIIEQNIWNYLERKVIDHQYAQMAFFNLMSGYYGFQLPGDDLHLEEFDLVDFCAAD